MSISLLAGDCRQTLVGLEPESVQCVITSPPYFGLRDYGTEPLVWGGWTGSLGLEPTPEMYVEHLVEVFRQVKRVLRPDGLLWLNLGDSYAGKRGNSAARPGFDNKAAAGHADFRFNGTDVPAGLKRKDLLLTPWRVATALQADGWWLRSMIPWLKRNAMPESVMDRPATTVEYVLLLAKSERYYWNAESVRLPNARESSHPSGRNRRTADWFLESWQGLILDEDDDPLALVVNGIPFKGAHYATFPPKLIEPMVQVSTRAGDSVLDPFAGAGTVGLVADRLGRHAVLCELKPDYANIAGDRITGDAPLFVQLEAF